MRWFDRAIKTSVRAAVSKAVDEIVTPEFVQSRLRKLFVERPNCKLTETGFGNAMALALHDIWPDLPVDECARLMREELCSAGVFYGDDKYQWTAAAATELAKEYAATYGEAP